MHMPVYETGRDHAIVRLNHGIAVLRDKLRVFANLDDAVATDDYAGISNDAVFGHQKTALDNGSGHSFPPYTIGGQLFVSFAL
jgi:hypothetical protein